jgi:hypothetical protein
MRRWCIMISVTRALARGALATKETHMKRALAALIAVALIQTLAACGTLAGGAIGAGIGSTQGRTAEGAAIGGGLGMIYDISR